MSRLVQEQGAIPPVWQVIPRFFRYPFRMRVLPGITVISLLSLLTVLPLAGGIFAIIVLVAMYKFSYEVLISTAQGDLEGPTELVQISGWITLKHIVLMVGMFFMVMGATILTGSLLVGLLTGLFVISAGPAAIMTLAMTESLLAALNPVTWVTIMQRTGLSYFLAGLFLLMMGLSQAFTDSLLIQLFGRHFLMDTVVSSFITLYFMTAAFHLMGYVMYARHEELGVELTSSGGDRALHELAEDNSVINQAKGMVAQGQSDEAAQILRAEIVNHGGEPELHEYYRKLQHTRGDQPALLDHGREYIPILIHGQERTAEALRIADECLQIDRDFKLSNADDVRTLATLAFEQSKSDLVLRLTNGFAKRHPNHSHIPDNYLLAARALSELKGQDEQASKILKGLKRKYPQHPLSNEIEKLLQAVSGAPNSNDSAAGQPLAGQRA